MRHHLVVQAEDYQEMLVLQELMLVVEEELKVLEEVDLIQILVQRCKVVHPLEAIL
jgi:hypothetical protein